MKGAFWTYFSATVAAGLTVAAVVAISSKYVGLLPDWLNPRTP